MSESLVQVTEGVGKKLHTAQRTVGANNVEDEYTLPGEYDLPTYTVVAANISIGTSGDHIIALNAGASLKVRIRRITVEQAANATAAGSVRVTVVRTTTTTPTGGSAITPAPHETSDVASGAVARSLPTVKGTETVTLGTGYLTLRQAVSATGAVSDDAPYVWTQMPNSKPFIIPVGATNGIVIKVGTGVAGATVDATIEFVELAY